MIYLLTTSSQEEKPQSFQKTDGYDQLHLHVSFATELHLSTPKCLILQSITAGSEAAFPHIYSVCHLSNFFVRESGIWQSI